MLCHYILYQLKLKTLESKNERNEIGKLNISSSYSRPPKVGYFRETSNPHYIYEMKIYGSLCLVFGYPILFHLIPGFIRSFVQFIIQFFNFGFPSFSIFNFLIEHLFELNLQSTSTVPNCYGILFLWFWVVSNLVVVCKKNEQFYQENDKKK